MRQNLPEIEFIISRNSISNCFFGGFIEIHFRQLVHSNIITFNLHATTWRLCLCVCVLKFPLCVLPKLVSSDQIERGKIVHNEARHSKLRHLSSFLGAPLEQL